MFTDYKILAVDFDGTLCEENWPGIGHPNHEVIEHVKKEKENGAKLILWTCRIEPLLTEAIEWCRGHGIEFDAVNDNLPDICEQFPVNGPKIYYDELIDDKHCSKFNLPYVKDGDQVLVELYGDSGLVNSFYMNAEIPAPEPFVQPETYSEAPKPVSWAEKEIEIACKLERGESKTPDEDWDYGCSCYDSALKAYNSLNEDGHSGFSITLTQRILNRLIEHKPLTPIYDTDDIWSDIIDRNDEKGYTCYQCERMSSLFKYVYDNGTIRYSDVNNCYAVDIHNRSAYSNGTTQRIMDELYPIGVPYYPGDPTVFYCEEFLYDVKNGDFDTIGVLYLVRPDGERKEVNRFFKETKDGFKRISRIEYTARKTFRERSLVKHGSL